jgi:hypothetical protein
MNEASNRRNENVFTAQAIDLGRDAPDMDVRTLMVLKFAFEQGYQRARAGFLGDG